MWPRWRRALAVGSALSAPLRLKLSPQRHIHQCLLTEEDICARAKLRSEHDWSAPRVEKHVPPGRTAHELSALLQKHAQFMQQGSFMDMAQSEDLLILRVRRS